MREALAARHMGKVIRAYRRHLWHGRSGLRQEEVAAWAGINQPQLSRIENGPAISHLDRLISWAGLLGIPQQYLWFDLPDTTVVEASPAATDAPGLPEDAVEWPVQVGRPPARPRAFQWREGLATQIASAMADDDSAVLWQVVTAGGGGVGKTQMAAALFSQARETGVELLVWVDASSRESIVTSYAQARGAIRQGVASGASADEAAQAFLGWLAVTGRSWMVVLDDVADPADVRSLWPEGRAGRVLATTRRRDLAPAGARQVSVGVFTAAEAHQYLVERLTGGTVQPAHPRVLDDAAALAEELGFLPVALAQAAAVVLNEGVTCAEYRRRFAGRSSGFDRLFPADAGADDYAHTVSTTWSLAIERADQLPPAGLARPALQLAAVVDPNGAPEALWATNAVSRFLASHRSGGARAGAEPADPAVAPGQTSVDEARAALRNLHRLSLVTHEPGGGALAVRTHALVQRATLEPLTAERVAETVQVAADALLEIWPPTETDPSYSRVLRQTTATLAGRAPDVLWSPEGHEVVFRAGQSLGELLLVQDTITYWSEVAATADRVLGPDHPQALTARHNLADWRGVAGDPAEAAQALGELLTESVRVLGPDHPDTLAARHDLADWRGVAGDATDAAEALEELLTDLVRVLGADDPQTLTARHNLAYWRGAGGDAAGAAAAFEDLLGDCRRVLGADHAQTFTARHNLARWRGVAGDAAGAVRAFEELYQDRARALGTDHPDTFDARIAIAYWRGVAGDAAGAAQANEELLGIASRVLGPDHPHTLTIRHNLAYWRGMAGDMPGAIEVLRALRDDHASLLGADHPETLGTRIHLAWCEGAADPADAVRSLEELVDDHLRLHGPDHPQTLTAREDLAYWRGASGDPAGAAAAFEALLHDRLKVLGPDHPHILTTRRYLARWRGAAGDAAGAVRALEDLLADSLQTLGPDHHHTLTTQHTLAYWRGADGDAAGAAQTLEDVLDGCRRVLGEEHDQTDTVRRHLARWHALASGTSTAADLAPAVEELYRERLRLGTVHNPHTLTSRIGLGDWRIGGRVRSTKTWPTQRGDLPRP
jgi:transcriptional regulator with XRE-family HTH domain